MAEKSTYKRLQVDKIWLRTIFEIIAIILAIVVCGNMVVSNYEESYAAATRKSAEKSSMQLAHSISGVVSCDALAIEDDSRLDYAAQRTKELLESCFISGDMLFSGAVYRVTPDGAESFASTDQFVKTLEDQRLMSDGKPVQSLMDNIERAISGEEGSASTESAYFSFVPVNDADGTPSAVVVTAVEFRDSLEYQSTVRKRLTMISVVSGALILIYYCISAALSQSRKKKGKVVS